MAARASDSLRTDDRIAVHAVVPAGQSESPVSGSVTGASSVVAGCSVVVGSVVGTLDGPVTVSKPGRGGVGTGPCPWTGR